MCTASWVIDPGGYELFFNRDESVRRGLARPPEPAVLAGVRVLAPTDSDAGGTWIGVNEHGLALALLNAWDARESPEETRSRGLLVRDLLPARNAAEARARLSDEDLARYRGFTLLFFEPGRSPRLCVWDGASLGEHEARRPLASSSLDRARAQRERERALERACADPARPTSDELARFQASHEPERGPWSACMHRSDAATVSATRVRVTPRGIAMRYAAGPPCTSPFSPWRTLEAAP